MIYKSTCYNKSHMGRHIEDIYLVNCQHNNHQGMKKHIDYSNYSDMYLSNMMYNLLMILNINNNLKNISSIMMLMIKENMLMDIVVGMFLSLINIDN